MVDYNLILNIFLGVLSYKVVIGLIKLGASKLQEKLEEMAYNYEEDEE